MFISTLITVASASVVGSLHCAAMCGGLVSFTCGTSDNPKWAQLTYHAGRLATYAGLGALAGYAGGALDQTAEMSGLQSLTGLITGGVMIAWALGSLLRRRWRRPDSEKPKDTTTLVRLTTKKPRTSRLGRWFARIHRMPAGARGLLLGLTSAVLPCGWLYVFVASAAAQGTPAAGALLMSAFWVGTLPMLVGLGGIVALLGNNTKRYLPQLSTVVLLALGLTTLVLRRPVDMFHGFGDSAPADASSSHHSCH